MSRVPAENRALDAPLIAELRQGIVHATDVASYLGIVREGHLRPNDGSFRGSFPQSSNSCCRQLKAVSLFDFINASDEQLDDNLMRRNWQVFFSRRHPTVCLQFPVSALKKRLIRYEEAVRRAGLNAFIKPVEVCYPGNLPVSDVKRVILVDRCRSWRIRAYSHLPSDIEMDDFMRGATPE